MKTRHKQPTLVSMWMLDVFCCALGCVTLLWLLNTREAKLRARAAGETANVLAKTKIELDDTRYRLNAEVERLNNRVAALETERDDTARKLGIAEAQAKTAQDALDSTKLVLNDAEQALKNLQARAADAAEMLRKKQLEEKELAAKVVTLEKLLREKDQDRADAAKRVVKLEEELDDLNARLAAARKDADAAVTAKADAMKREDQLFAAQGKVRELQKKVDDANATMIDLQGQKAKLADKLDRLRIETESKFAGIAMTGKRVVFLVDMSGSMDRTDENTLNPGKWPLVRETVAKVMRSIPDLDRFQVILFARDTRFLVGTGADWLPYQGERTIKEVTDALTAVKPNGDTNLYAAMDQAFQFRDRGLDTIYLFSDGLPTSGPGLTASQTTSLTEPQKGEILARYIRRTLTTSWNRGSGGGGKVKINSVGFFYESPDVGAFLWALSRENDGSFVGMSRP
jgi:uncharacterized protein YlxW (UPF0749 family)